MLALVRQVFGPGKVWPHDRGVTEVDRDALNAVLQSAGLRLRSQRVDTSERQVKTRLDVNRYGLRAVFWLDQPPGAGVVEERPDEDPEPEGDTPEHQGVLSGPLALPEGTGA